MAPISVPQVAVLEGFNCSRIWQNTSDVIFYFHAYTIWLPINITGDKLLLQSYIFLFYFIENSETFELAECSQLIFSVFGQKVWRKQIKKKGSLLLYKLPIGRN